MISRWSSSRYISLLASQGNITIKKSSIPKTETRFTAENSLISSCIIRRTRVVAPHNPPKSAPWTLKKRLSAATETASDDQEQRRISSLVKKKEKQKK